MSRNKRDVLHTVYFIGGMIILVLAIVALVAFYKAVSFEPTRPFVLHGFADSIKVENIQKDVAELTQRVDSMEVAMRQRPEERCRNANNQNR